MAVFVARLAAPASSKRPESCPGGRFLVLGESLVDSDPASPNEPIVISGTTISIGEACPPTKARLRGSALGSRLTAKWHTCLGLHGRARLRALIDPNCSAVTGAFIARRPKIRVTFAAHLSRCGDGLIDHGGGEQCEMGAGCRSNETCASCTCVPVHSVGTPSSTTTTTSASTTTTSTTLAAKTDWVTYGFDLQRTSRNPSEVTLGADNVGRLGQIWSTDVGAVVAASPVLASDVSVDGTTLDLLYIATEHGDLYALDAATGRVVWQRNLGSQLTACADMPDGVFGITDTPFVNRTTRSLFVVGGDGNLYALDLATGTTRAGWPVTITSDPAHEHGWSALTLAGGALYVETASYFDLIPYYGRVVKIDLPTPSVVATWYVTSAPGAGPGGGGIWGWGGASVEASGDLYVATGNATTTPESYGYGERVVRLSSALEVQASNYPGLNGYDLDFGSTPVSYQAPGCHGQIVVENKLGLVFVYQRDAIASGPTQRVEIGNGQLIGVPAYDSTTRMVYVSNSTDLSGGEYRHGLVAF